MNHTSYLRECLRAALIQQGHDVECLSDALEFIGPDAKVEITLGTASNCGSSNSYVAHLRIQSLNEIEEDTPFDYDHSLLWHSSNFVGIRFRPYADDSPALALRLIDIANIAQVVAEIVTKYGPLGLVGCVQYATGDEIHLVEGTASGVTMILEGQERGVTFTDDQRAFMLGANRAAQPYSIRSLWATSLTMLDADTTLGAYAQEISRSMLVEEFQHIYTNAPSSNPAGYMDEFDENEDSFDSMCMSVEMMYGRNLFSAQDMIAQLAPQVICNDPLNAQQKEAAAIFGTKILSDLPLYVSAAFSCFIALGNRAYAAVQESNTPDLEALRVCNSFLSLYEEPWSTGSTEVREWIRIATTGNACELASYYATSIINNVALDEIDAQARAIMDRHNAENEALSNVLDAEFWNGSMHQLVRGPRFKMALREITLSDVLAGTGPIRATRDGVDKVESVVANADHLLFAPESGEVQHVGNLLEFAAKYVGKRKNTWADYSIGLMRHMPLSLVATLAMHNAVELTRDPSDVVKTLALSTHLGKAMAVYLDYMNRLMDFDVPQYPVNEEYVEEMANMLRSGNVDVAGALYDLVIGSAVHHSIDLLQRPLREYNSISQRVKAHAMVKSHYMLPDLTDQSAAAMVNRLGSISALFKSARVPTDHTRVVEYIETKLALEFKGVRRSDLNPMVQELPTRSVYFLTVLLALSDIDTLESFLSNATKTVRKDATLRSVWHFIKSVRKMAGEAPDAESSAGESDGEEEASNRGRPFQATLPKSEVATFRLAKASTCKQARKLSAMNVARAVYAEFDRDVSVFGYHDCNSFCRAVSDKVGEVVLSDVLARAATVAARNCDLDVDQLHDILRHVPLVVACTIYVADLLGVSLEAIDALNKDTVEDTITSKSAIFVSYVVNADFSTVRHDDADIVEDIADSVLSEQWPWGDDSTVGKDCIHPDLAEMGAEDMIVYAFQHDLMTEDKARGMETTELHNVIKAHFDALDAKAFADEERADEVQES